jgi:murein L,D-transpeptidase YafK
LKKTKPILIFLFAIILLAIVYNLYPSEKLKPGEMIDKIVINKSKREMLIYSKGNLLKTYKIALGKNPIGDKQFEGDDKTPEGLYSINDKNPNSSYHKNLGVSYPNGNDSAEAKSFNKPVGGNIKIHGIRNYMGIIGKFHALRDWTKGCIAVSDEEIDELFEHVPIGTPIQINP